MVHPFRGGKIDAANIAVQMARRSFFHLHFWLFVAGQIFYFHHLSLNVFASSDASRCPAPLILFPFLQGRGREDWKEDFEICGQNS